MENCMGVINFSEIDPNFGTLCKDRPSGMLPYGGRYRMIDFFLSNMVNYNITTIGVFTGTKIRSIMDHVGSGKSWDLNRRFKGIFLFPPLYDEYNIKHLGNINHYYSNKSFFKKSREDNIYFVNTESLFKPNLEEAYQYFLGSNADITILYKKVQDPKGQFLETEKITLAEDGCLQSLGVNLGTEEEFALSTGSFFIKKEVFYQIINEAIEKGNATTLKEAMLLNRKKYKINTWEYTGHLESVRDVKSYYDANMNLLKGAVYDEMFFNNGMLYTKTEDEPSTFYQEEAKVVDSLIANGCSIEGNVLNSLVFRGVKIGKGAIVKNSIIMQKSIIEDGAVVVNSIVDKASTIKAGVEIVGSATIPYVVDKESNIQREDEQS